MALSIEERASIGAFLRSKQNQVTEIHQNWKKTTNSDVLIIDGTNTFIRCWSANPAMDDNGNHTGGIVGSLKSIGYAIKFLAPTRCIVVFDGIGGSQKRRQLFPQYKEKRKGKIRLNRQYEDLTDVTTEEESCTKQYLRLTHYLQTFPVNMLSLDYVEADDVIAFLATEVFKDSNRVTIMSSDKDFLQLCLGNVRVYSPTKKRLYGTQDVINEYQIHPNNYVLYRALDGDDSDNVNGIEGAGPKTIVKHFPWLNEEAVHTIDEVISHAVNVRNKFKVCENISEGKSILERNMALMQLKETALTTTGQLHCIDCLQTSKIPRLDRNAFYKLVRDDRIDGNLPNHFNWVNDVFDSLDKVTRQE
jgi:DNA polymerase-1